MPHQASRIPLKAGRKQRSFGAAIPAWSSAAQRGSLPTMDQTRIRQLYALLPPGAAYPATRRSLFQPRLSAPERFALALHDPAFGWHFVEAHLKVRRWLPDAINEWSLLQCHTALWLGVSEPLMLEVESFRTQTRRHERDLLEALLLAEKTSLGRIAELLDTREEVIEAFEALFFNVRDRKHEKAYLNALLHPDGWQAAMRDAKPTPEGDRLRLLRAGAENDVEEVLALAGFQRRREQGTLVDKRGALERRMQMDAERRMQAGCRLEDAVVRAAHTAAVRQQEIATDDDPMALHNINAVSPALDELRKYNSLKAVPRPDYKAESEAVHRRARELIEAHRKE